MKSECLPSRPPLPWRRRGPPAAAPGITEGARTSPAQRRAALREAFRAETSPHVDAVYSDAFCLTGGPERAADLVVAAYVRAFAQYEQFRRRRVSGHTEARSTLAWLYGNMHAAFCDGVLAHQAAALIGGRP